MRLTIRRAILLYTIVPVVIIFVISAASGVTFLKSRIEAQVNAKMTKVASGYANGLDDRLRRLAGETQRTADTLQAIPDMSEEQIYGMLRLHVEDDPVVYGAAIAFKPYTYRKDRKLFSPYVFNSEDGLKQIDIGKDSYDYTDGSWEWWSSPSRTGKGVWTEPYLDEGAGNILMTTFSAPFSGKDGEFRGVVTLDIGLEALRDQRFRINHKQFALISQNNNILYHFKPEWIGRTVNELVEYTAGVTGFDTSEIARQALSGDDGSIHIPVKFDGDTAWLFYAPIESTGWTLGLWAYDSKTFDVVQKNLWRSIIFFCLLLLFVSIAVFYLSKRFSGPIESLVEQCRRMERLNFQPVDKVSSNILEIKHLATTLERMRKALLSISSVREDIRIAKSIRRHTIPESIPEVPGFDIQACSKASADIGGEAYDIIEYQAGQDSSGGIALFLFDVAGFGLAATITGSQLRAIYRTAARSGLVLQTIAEQMNHYLCADISGGSLVETWYGLIEEETSRVTTLSFGQIPALHFVAGDNEFYRLESSQVPLGSRIDITIPDPQTVQLAPGDMVIFVSDGVVSALNADRVAFGFEGIQQVIRSMPGASAKDIVQAISDAIASFTSSAETALDLTIVLFKCTDGCRS